MDNLIAKNARFDDALAQAYSDLNECLWTMHNLSQSLRALRMQFDVMRASREALLRDNEKIEAAGSRLRPS